MKIIAINLCLTVVTLVITVLSTPPAAQSRNDMGFEVRRAQESLAAADYEESFKEYTFLAEEKKNLLAQFTLGLFFKNGWGRPENQIQACKWFGQAAVGGIPAAQHFFAGCLNEGIGQPVDPGQAAVWFEKAASQGHIMSLCSLGDLYVSGRGVSTDPVKGLALYRQAAEQGVISAQIKMGHLLLERDASIRNAEEALKWYQAAAQTNMPEAQYYLGIMAREGLGMVENPLVARTWFERAASQGHLPAYFPTAKLYFLSIGEQQHVNRAENDLAKAYMWLSATARRLQDGDELRHTENMLAEVVDIMPKPWAEILDAKVSMHLKEFRTTRE